MAVSRIYTDKEQDNSYKAYCDMEDLLDKLKLLNYEAEFLNFLKIKPIHRYYFIIMKNPGEQFYLFSSLAAWLIRKMAHDFDQPQEYDDPNETISKIINIVRETGITVDFSPNKLKQGIGDHVIYLLNSLANETLNRTKFVYQKPKPPEEKEEEIETIDDESEINLDRVEEEMIQAYSDDSDDDNIFHIDDLQQQRNKRNNNLSNNSNYIGAAAKVDEESWKLELERVLPNLKVTIRNDNRDWRVHLNQMKQHKANIDGSLAGTQGQLRKLHKDIAVALEKIGNREKYLNRELDTVLEEYRSVQDQLSKIKDKYRGLSGGVAERNRELSRLTDKLESVKQQMEEKGSSMTDGTPLVNIKKSVSRIKAEIVDMDVRIGVLNCISLQTKIRDQKLLENEFGQSISVF